MVATSPRADEQAPALSAREAGIGASAQREGEAALVRAHLPAVWRVLRRIGLSPHDADDVAQEVFMTAFRKSASIEPGKEKAFLFGIALRLAARKRRWLRLRWRTASAADVDAQLSRSPNASELIEHKEALLLLDRTLGAMSEELRTTFVLFELEEMTMNEIAELTKSKPGTVASRLRRARELVSEAARAANGERK
jgi:RNA polymerase sigma-70 factor, ECF subfamily